MYTYTTGNLNKIMYSNCIVTGANSRETHNVSDNCMDYENNFEEFNL